MKALEVAMEIMTGTAEKSASSDIEFEYFDLDESDLIYVTDGNEPKTAAIIRDPANSDQVYASDSLPVAPKDSDLAPKTAINQVHHTTTTDTGAQPSRLQNGLNGIQYMMHLPNQFPKFLQVTSPWLMPRSFWGRPSCISIHGRCFLLSFRYLRYIKMFFLHRYRIFVGVFLEKT